MVTTSMTTTMVGLPHLLSIHHRIGEVVAIAMITILNTIVEVEPHLVRRIRIITAVEVVEELHMQIVIPTATTLLTMIITALLVHQIEEVEEVEDTFVVMISVEAHLLVHLLQQNSETAVLVMNVISGAVKDNDYHQGNKVDILDRLEKVLLH